MRAHFSFLDFAPWTYQITMRELMCCVVAYDGMPLVIKPTFELYGESYYLVALKFKAHARCILFVEALSEFNRAQHFAHSRCSIQSNHSIRKIKRN